jgi:uncharacterized protein (DUF1499 family)
MKKVIRTMGLGTAVAIIAILGLLAYIRLAPSDASWHVDPTTVTAPAKPNHWLIANGGDAPALALTLSPDAAAAKLAAIAAATPRTTLLDGQGLHTTWITRSAILGFPDYTSVTITPTATGSEIALYARSRFGQSDFGVNRARVESWLRQLAL